MARKRQDDFLPEIPQDAAAPGMPVAIPSDQTAPVDPSMAPAPAPSPEPGGSPMPGAGAPTPPPGVNSMLAAMGSQSTDPTMDPTSFQGDTGQMSDDQLASMTGQDPTEADAQAMAAALDDPSVPPDQKQLIQQQIALAARRKLAGV